MRIGCIRTLSHTHASCRTAHLLDIALNRGPWIMQSLIDASHIPVARSSVIFLAIFLLHHPVNTTRLLVLQLKDAHCSASVNRLILYPSSILLDMVCIFAFVHLAPLPFLPLYLHLFRSFIVFPSPLDQFSVMVSYWVRCEFRIFQALFSEGRSFGIVMTWHIESGTLLAYE